jgi:hypothetical protein
VTVPRKITAVGAGDGVTVNDGVGESVAVAVAVGVGVATGEGVGDKDASGVTCPAGKGEGIFLACGEEEERGAQPTKHIPNTTIGKICATTTRLCLAA